MFKVYQRENKEKALQYMEGLFHEGKHNIERMNERVEKSRYQQLHHFVSVSPWDHRPVTKAIGEDMGRLFEGRAELTGLIMDESGHRKGGRKSVGVARQYLGSIGKVDNGQVAVFAALSQGDDVGMVDTRLYLPKGWTGDGDRCEEAGIPVGHRDYRTKPQLALEMIKGMHGRVKFGWVGGDCAYGNSKGLRQGLQGLGQLFVMDVPESMPVYLEPPRPYVPAPKTGRGRKRSRYVSGAGPLKLKDLKEGLTAHQWKTYTIRKGAKGPMKRKVAVLTVYVWGADGATGAGVEKLRLVVSCNTDGSEVKYSVANDIGLDNRPKLSDWGCLYRQMQRYWVERGIQDCKDSLGMTDYQVRGWRAWHHHMTLTMMALHFMVEQKVVHQEEIPLLSCPDIKFFLALNLPRKAKNLGQVWGLIQKRHEQRQNDLNRYT